jgi:hypothetical protein
LNNLDRESQIALLSNTENILKDKYKKPEHERKEIMGKLLEVLYDKKKDKFLYEGQEQESIINLNLLTESLNPKEIFMDVKDIPATLMTAETVIYFRLLDLINTLHAATKTLTDILSLPLTIRKAYN